MAQGQGAGARRRGVAGGARALRDPPESLAAGAAAILGTAEPAAKVAASRALAAAWRAGDLPVGWAEPPPRPARPVRPLLRPPREMAKRRAFGSLAGRLALLHALAHIELNAIDLGWDILARFSPLPLPLPRAFFDDWVAVAAEEAEHFALLAGRLAVVPLVLEARGLDVTPQMAARLERAGDSASAAILARIYEDEIGHVATGRCWFERLCGERGLGPETVFHDRVRRFFKGALKPPFNHVARAAAGFPPPYWEPLSAPA